MTTDFTGIMLLESIKNSATCKGPQLLLRVGHPVVAYLRPLSTQKYKQSLKDVTFLTNCRNQFPKSFLTEFKSTISKTSNWLAEEVSRDNTKILFMVDLPNGQTIGYMGLAFINWEKKYAEADAIVRGVPAQKGIMAASLAVLLEWAQVQLKIKEIGVRVISDNPAIEFYRKCGFIEKKRIPLSKKEECEKNVWFEDENNMDPERFLVRFYLKKEKMFNTFKEECIANAESQYLDGFFLETTKTWIKESFRYKYMYNYESLGRPIIQIPQDVMAMQELIWQIKPDLIVETGIAHGGSLIFSASMLALLDLCDAIKVGEIIDPKLSKRKVLGIDIDIRAHNRAAIEAHPMHSRIQMIEGSSIAPEIITQVKAVAANYSRVLVCLDSNHTHDHVLAELEAYAPLTSVGSYCVVFDTVVEDMPADMFPDRPWGPGNNPKTAVWEYLKTHPEFEIDKSIQHKLLITVAPDGYLKRLR